MIGWNILKPIYDKTTPMIGWNTDEPKVCINRTYQSSCDVIGLDNDAIVLLLGMMHQLVVSIHYSTSVSTRDKLRIDQVLSKCTRIT